MRTPTSATSNRARLQQHRQRGFTLVELMVVFGLAALLMAIVPIAYGRLHESSQYRETLRNMVADLRGARMRAQTEGREVRFTVDLAHRTYGVDGRPQRPLPETLEVKTTVATIEMTGSEAASIRFLPSGGATGGMLDIVRPSGAGTRLSVDWFSGQVTQGPLE